MWMGKKMNNANKEKLMDKQANMVLRSIALICLMFTQMVFAQATT